MNIPRSGCLRRGGKIIANLIMKAGLLATLLTFLSGWPACGSSASAQDRQMRQVQIVTRRLRLDYDLAAGLWNCRWSGGASIRRASCMARLSDGTEITPAGYSKHECSVADRTTIRDGFGKGTRIVVHHRGAGKPELRQTLEIYPDKSYVLVTIDVISPGPIASNYMAPLVIDSTHATGAGLHLDTGEKPRALFVPFDNDMFVRYNSDNVASSYEVTAVYDNTSRHGFVLGSITHDVWKTGFEMKAFGPRILSVLRAYGGAAGQGTHDSQPHGKVRGTILTSPRILAGYFSDWRDGLEGFGRANAVLQPPLHWASSAPMGWNSWYAYGTKVDQDRYLKVSNYFHKNLQPQGFPKPGSIYINFDSFWDNLNEAQLIETVNHVHGNGQKAGIYWTPFTFWGDDLERPVPGTGDKYRFRDILLKDAEGRLLPKLDNGHPVDATHPGAVQWIDWTLDRFARWGFDFIKLDFINAGALEGAHYDPHITTGIGAYRSGMQRIVTDISPTKVGRPFFISLSIAPLFPAGCAHSRRISCDVGGDLSASSYMLNSLTYGWWAAGALYRFNDPDMIILSASGHEARTRVNSCVITGAPLLDSDDLTRPDIQQRAQQHLTNPQVFAIARSARPFRPVEGDTGAQAADTFVRDDGPSGFLVAIFNYDNSHTRNVQLDLPRLGLRRSLAYTATDLWTGQILAAQDTLSTSLGPAESKIFRLVR